MSKSFAMTGYRIGFTRGQPNYIELAAKLQEPLVSCSAGFSQMASADGLDRPFDCIEEMRLAYRRRRDVAVEVLRHYDLYRYTPGGAFYLLIDISSTGMDSRDFALKLISDKKVAVAPGNTFGQMCRNHVRISIAAAEENIREGLKRLCEMIHENAS